MIEYQNSLTQVHGRSRVHAPESRRRSKEGMMGSEEGSVGGCPEFRRSWRAFWRVPREWDSRYLWAIDRDC